MSMIEVEQINTYYGDSHVLFDLSMDVREREVVALLGRNGAGKSTTLKTLAGVLHPSSGTIRFEGVPIGLASWRRCEPRPYTRRHVFTPPLASMG